MVRLSKRVEYGLIAIRHIATRPYGEIVNAKEIAEQYKIPYELLAKVLQKLTKAGLIASHQGVHGGYTLAKKPGDIPVSHVIHAIEGTRPVIAECLVEGATDHCTVFSVCTIKSPLTKVQANIELAFNSMTVLEIV
jgi:Rrf2 family transcriptional regulator, cysteine metabolism repressor